MQAATRKTISISSKRQITIPQSFYDRLGFSTQADCILKDGGLFIRPINFVSTADDFSTEILSDLIKQGYSGNELLSKFKEQKVKIRAAVETLIQKADEAVHDDSTKSSFGELFGDGVKK